DRGVAEARPSEADARVVSVPNNVDPEYRSLSPCAAARRTAPHTRSRTAASRASRNNHAGNPSWRSDDIGGGSDRRQPWTWLRSTPGALKVTRQRFPDL